MADTAAAAVGCDCCFFVESSPVCSVTVHLIEEETAARDEGIALLPRVRLQIQRSGRRQQRKARISRHVTVGQLQQSCRLFANINVHDVGHGYIAQRASNQSQSTSSRSACRRCCCCCCLLCGFRLPLQRARVGLVANPHALGLRMDSVRRQADPAALQSGQRFSQNTNVGNSMAVRRVNGRVRIIVVVGIHCSQTCCFCCCCCCHGRIRNCGMHSRMIVSVVLSLS